jgi:hypothetical protein
MLTALAYCIGVVDQLGNSVGPSNEEKCPQKNQKTVKPVPGVLQNSSAFVFSMVIELKHAEEHDR